MKILHVSAYFSPSWAFGGIPRVVDGLTAAQTNLGHDVSILTTDAYDEMSRSAVPKFRQSNKRSVFTLTNLSNRLAYKQFPLPLFSSVLKEQISNADLVHLHGARNLLVDFVLRRTKIIGH